MGRHTGHRRKAKPKQSPRSYLPRLVITALVDAATDSTAAIGSSAALTSPTDNLVPRHYCRSRQSQSGEETQRAGAAAAKVVACREHRRRS
eukprot:4438589-Prymnesium_polylepis.1